MSGQNSDTSLERLDVPQVTALSDLWILVGQNRRLTEWGFIEVHVALLAVRRVKLNLRIWSAPISLTEATIISAIYRG